MHWNSVISNPGSRYLVVDVKKFYLNNIMSNHEYYNIAIILIPQEVIDEYNLMENKINGFLYVRTEKGMYGIVQAGIISHTALKEHLRPFIYEPAPITPGLWRFNKNGIIFTLVVDEFGIKYKRKEDEMHIIHALQEIYDITKYWTGSLYSGTTLNWDYKAGILDISMAGYIKEALHKFQHPTPRRPHNSPHQWNPPNYSSAAPQLAHQSHESPKLDPP